MKDCTAVELQGLKGVRNCFIYILQQNSLKMHHWIGLLLLCLMNFIFLFPSLQALQELDNFDVSGNQLISFPAETFSYCSKLQVLNVSSNEVGHSSLFNLTLEKGESSFGHCPIITVRETRGKKHLIDTRLLRLQFWGEMGIFKNLLSTDFIVVY